MKLALDASVLLTVFNQEPGAEDWIEVLIQARRQSIGVVFRLHPAFVVNS